MSDAQLEMERSKERNIKKRKRHLNDINKVLSHVEGRRVVWEIMSASGVFRQSFINSDPNSTAFNEGKRSLGLLLFRDIFNHYPETVLKMRKEFMSDQLSEAESKLGVQENE